MYRLKRLGLQIAWPWWKLYLLIARPDLGGVRCVIEYEGHWLMVRNAYGWRRWTFPGGLIDFGETPHNAVVREVAEEVGLRLSSVRLLGRLPLPRGGYVQAYFAESQSRELNIDSAEILVAQWFATDQLPRQMSPIALKMVRLTTGQPRS